ncbi:hypothetical protein EXIGLDRAFT_834137 [Exidia glandulosa HHB12029]|uniref:F-box domain-containing protein n=1 Tax=Exidia glandulosa HHB12029 TaxID=1314781 RepID=A0A165K492_EXIGL|nr:hypothetical protein EXIGLDRAFT_834137 [Exidia glandulosa HHB12029]
MSDSTCLQNVDTPTAPIPAERPSTETVAQPANLLKRLTDENLCMIFGYLTVGGRIRASAVSRAWRRAAMTSPSRAQLWSSLSLPRTRPEGLIALLKRAGPVPIQLLRIDISTKTAGAIASYLGLYMFPFEVLHLNINYSDPPSDTHAAQLVEALCKPAHSLKRFALVDVGNVLREPFERNVGKLFARTAPKLRSVKLYSAIRNFRRCIVFASVESLHFAYAYPHSAPMSPTDLREIFKIFPKAKTLALQIDRYEKEKKKTALLRPPASLSTLVLSANAVHPRAAVFALAKIPHVDIPHVHVDYVDVNFRRSPEEEFTFDSCECEFWSGGSDEDGYDDDASSVMGGMDESERNERNVSLAETELSSFASRTTVVELSLLSVRTSWSSRPSYQVEVADGRGRRLSQAAFPWAVTLPPRVYNQIASLHLHEQFLYGTVQPLPPVPKLEQLSVFIPESAPSHGRFSKYDGSKAVYSELSSGIRTEIKTTLACPSLRSIRIAYALDVLYPTPRLALSPKNVEDFLRTRLSYAREKLASLAFVGIRLAQDDTFNPDGVSGLADSVTFEPLPVHKPRAFDELLTWES